MTPGTSHRRRPVLEFTVVLLLLLAALSFLLRGVFVSDQTLFSNDGPLGQLMAQCHQLPDRFFGCWNDLNVIGFNTGAATPGISDGLQYLLKPVLFSKFYALFSLVVLGLGAWTFFVNLRLTPAACVLGGLAAALNSCFFSTASWGMAAHPITVGMTFFALAALADNSSRQRWWRVILAGLAVGMGVVEGADVGAIFSLYVAAFVIYQAWTSGGKRIGQMVTGLGRLTLVALCAALLAAPTLFSLVHTEIEGVVGTSQDAQTKAAKWDWATQWSLPVPEALSLVVPGLFGYRMDTPDGGGYWGNIGRDPAVDRYIQNDHQGEPPHGFIRYSGGGFYAGVLVVLLALWAVAQLLAGKKSIFNLAQRKWLWFWLAAGVVSLLLAFGRFAPFYQWVYALPYFSTIRNPIKFINMVSVALLIIFAYGMDGFWRRYLQPAKESVSPSESGWKNRWTKAGSFEKRWTYGCGLMLGIGLLAWLEFGASRQDLETYLRTVQFSGSEAADIAAFSFSQMGWFLVFFALSAGLLIAISLGALARNRPRLGIMLLALLLLADLMRVDQRWVVYWNYPEKYASNPIIDRLREHPYEHRVTIFPGPWPQDAADFNKLFHIGWLQQQFPYYNIQAFDAVSISRMPEDLKAYITAPGQGMTAFFRLWQLTNTRYIFGPANTPDQLNLETQPLEPTLRIIERFNIIPKLGITNPTMVDDLTATLADTGDYALFEFVPALPRAKLYSDWQVNPNNQAVLAQLASPVFNPQTSVLVSDEMPPGAAPASQETNAGTVDFTSYAPKDIRLKSDSAKPTVLLLNDHFDPAWIVSVDGQRKPLLRCNFIMQGVYLPAGPHTVEFQFQPPVHFLYVSLTAIILGLLILAVLLITSRRLPASFEVESLPSIPPSQPRKSLPRKVAAKAA
jgi:hypothetical protein